MPGSLGSSEDPLSGCTLLCCILTWWKKQRELSKIFFYEDVNLIRDLPSTLNDIPKTPLPNTITLGIRFQFMNWGGEWDTNIQSIAWSVRRKLGETSLPIK